MLSPVARFTPIYHLRRDVGLEGRSHVTHHLLNVDSRGDFDSLAVKPVLRLQPVREQPRFAHPAAADNSFNSSTRFVKASSMP